MSVEVLKWPPLKAAAYENTLSDPVSISRSSSGTPRGSQTEPNRRQVTFVAHGVENGMGYVETLKELLKGKLNLVQMTIEPAIWRMYWRDDPVKRASLSWTHGGAPLFWTHNGTPLEWYDPKIPAVAGDDGTPFVNCSGIAAQTTIRVGEVVVGGGVRALVTREARVAPDGTTRLYLTEAIPTGEVTIGALETRVFFIEDLPRSAQEFGGFTYQFNAVEVFANEYQGGFTVRNPWS